MSLVLTWAPASALGAHVIRTVPASIDPTGRIDVTRRLQDFVDAAPNGAVIVFPRRARYRLDGTLEWRDRADLTVDGNGATLFAGTHGGPTRAEVRVIDGTNWTIRDLTITGANPAGGRFDPRYQWQHGIDLRGVQGALIDNVTVTDVFGDDIYIGLGTGLIQRWSRDVSIIDSTGIGSGRMAIAITAGRNVVVRGGFWSRPGLSTFDVEPNGPRGGADGIVIGDTTIGAGSRASALNIAGNGPVSNVVFRDNRLVGRALTVLVDQGRLRPRNIVVRRNVSSVAFGGPGPAAMFFRAVDRVTVNANTQPLQPGRPVALIATQDSSEVSVAGQGPYLRLTPTGTLSAVIIGVGASLYLLVYCGAWRSGR